MMVGEKMWPLRGFQKESKAALAMRQIWKCDICQGK